MNPCRTLLTELYPIVQHPGDKTEPIRLSRVLTVLVESVACSFEDDSSSLTLSCYEMLKALLSSFIHYCWPPALCPTTLLLPLSHEMLHSAHLPLVECAWLYSREASTFSLDSTSSEASFIIGTTPLRNEIRDGHPSRTGASRYTETSLESEKTTTTTTAD